MKPPTLDQIGKRTDIFRLHLDHIIIPERADGKRFNVRTDFDDIPPFAKQILAAGRIKIPLLGHMRDGKFYPTDGERRVRAVRWLVANGHPKFAEDIPVKPEPKGYTEIERTLDLLFCASGKPLTMIEQAEVFRRLRDEHQLAVKDIAVKAGITQQAVYDCLTLIAAPEAVQEAVKSGKVSATLAVTALKENKTPADAVKAITAGIAKASRLGKKRATSAHIPTRRTAKARKAVPPRRGHSNTRKHAVVAEGADSVDKLRQIQEAVPRSRADYNKMNALEFLIDYLLGSKTLADAALFFKE